MDLGATICTPKPRCARCPLNAMCASARDPAGTAVPRAKTLRPAAYADTDRKVRGAIVKALTRRDMTSAALAKEIGDERVGRLAEALVGDGLIERAGRRYRLPV
ncbi:MAG: A/G-specific adenine glycosylase, partial [Chloroflexota bacterium]|nr:A/G-specific adenine glycosylase [Chloroflexota bacterium]